jgi:hypothetical protein
MTKCLLCDSDLFATSHVAYSGVSSVYSRSKFQEKFDLVTCECGLLQTLPRITGKDLAEIYQESYAYDFHKLVSSEKTARARGLAKIVRTQEHLSEIYEFGCAQDELLEVFQDFGWKVSGCEIGANSQKICREKGLNVTLCSAEIAVAGLEETSSLFVLSHVLEHLEDPKIFFVGFSSKSKTRFTTSGGGTKLQHRTRHYLR